MNTTKVDLCSRVSKKVDKPVVELKPILDAFLDEILTVLSEEQRIEFRGFGSFKVKERQQRLGRNPRTGQEVEVPSYLAPTFKFSKDGQRIFEDKLGKKQPKSKPKSKQPIDSTPAYSAKKETPQSKRVPSADSFSPI